MMLKLLATIFCTMLLVKGGAQSRNFAEVDHFAIAVGKADSLTIAQLTSKLTSPFEDPVSKTRAIYTWIAFNIVYDCPAFHNKAKRKGNPDIIYKERKGVCEGYANLFREMCSYANIQCITIEGFARNGSEMYENEGDGSEPNHAWNAVRINGEWHLVDATWGAGVTDKKVKLFTQDFSDAYFFPDPERFILSHYPVLDAWRLCKTALSKKRFFQHPVIAEGYLTTRINSFEPQNKVVNGKPGVSIRFSFTAEHVDSVHGVTVIVGEGKKEFRFEPSVERHGNKVEFSIRCPELPNAAPLAIYIDHLLSFVYQLQVP